MSAWHCISDAPRRADGSLKTNIGDREVVYLTSNDVPLCSVCAFEIERDEPGASHHGNVTMFGVHESGPDIHCEECSHAIHSYYGDPCACGSGSVGDYEGPLADCPIHGK